MAYRRFLGLGGWCICTNCGYKEPHKRAVPCATLRCPNCGNTLQRKVS